MAGPTERVFAATPIPTAGARVIAAPFQFWTSGEDNLRILSVNAMAGVALKVQARFVDAAGVISAASWDHTPASDRTVRSSDFRLGVGAVLNLVVFAVGATPKQGQTFVIVQLIRGVGTAAIVLGTLLQGYVTSTQVLAWPGSPIVASTEGEPAVRTIVGTQPAVGVNIVETCPTGARWQLLTVWHTASRGVATPAISPWFTVTASSGHLFRITAQQAIPAGTAAAEYSWMTGFSTPNAADGDIINTCVPTPVLMLAGQVFQVFPRDANLQLGAPAYTVREWLEVP